MVADGDQMEGDPMDLSKVTRVTVVGQHHGIVYEKYDLYDDGVDLLVQDDGRTLKILPRQKTNPPR